MIATHKPLNLEGFVKIKFKVSKTNHLLMKAKINGVSGNFIIDTGASNSCVGFESIGHFKLTASNSKTTASGAGATGMLTRIANNNELKIGKWKDSKFDLVIFDLTHVNSALVEHKAREVHGIIGANVLIDGKAIIDYGEKCIWLRKSE